MEPSRIVVISDSFHTLPEAVAVLTESGHNITYVEDFIPWVDLAGSDRDVLKEAQAVVTGRVLGINADAFSLAPNLRVVALHTSGSDNVDIDEATRRGVLVTVGIDLNGVSTDRSGAFSNF